MDLQKLKGLINEMTFAPENAERANAIIASGESKGSLSPEEAMNLANIFEDEADARKLVAQLLENLPSSAQAS